MDYDTFDNDTATDEEYTAFVEWLCEHTAEEFRRAQGDSARQKQVLCRYYKRGEAANLSTGELVDFLGVSSPSIFDMADYSDEEGDAVMLISANLTENDIA